MEDLRSQLTQLTQTLSVREPKKFPSQPNLNPAGQAHRAEALTSQSHEQVQSDISLRSGKEIEKFDEQRTIHYMVLEEVVDHSELDVNEAWEEEKRKIEEKGKDIIDEIQFEPEPLALQNLTITLKDPQNADEYEVFER